MGEKLYRIELARSGRVYLVVALTQEIALRNMENSDQALMYSGYTIADVTAFDIELGLVISGQPEHPYAEPRHVQGLDAV